MWCISTISAGHMNKVVRQRYRGKHGWRSWRNNASLAINASLGKGQLLTPCASVCVGGGSHQFQQTGQQPCVVTNIAYGPFWSAEKEFSLCSRLGIWPQDRPALAPFFSTPRLNNMVLLCGTPLLPSLYMPPG